MPDTPGEIPHLVRGHRQMTGLQKLSCFQSVSEADDITSAKFLPLCFLLFLLQKTKHHGDHFCCVVHVSARQSHMTPQAAGQGSLWASGRGRSRSWMAMEWSPSCAHPALVTKSHVHGGYASL
uniref:Uncharacterized protein n=1 Tax=Setaria viridis TaxID=4556 RepID=A0A4U6WBH7_SETVI|nr:hypothetical protein SEVIR_1G221800v2 [Setaria viridis]